MPTVVVNKKWAGDESALQNRPNQVEVVLLRDSQEYERRTLSSYSGWTYTWTELSSYYTWTVREVTQLEDYQASYNESESGSYWYKTYTFDITNTYIKPPEPIGVEISASVRFYNDSNYRDLRPIYVELVLKRNGEYYKSVRIGDGFEWNWIWNNLSKDYTWTVEAEQIPNYELQATQEGTDFQFLYKCTYTPPSPPDPSPGSHPTKGDLDLMYSVLYDDLSSGNAKDIIHILDYGTL